MTETRLIIIGSTLKKQDCRVLQPLNSIYLAHYTTKILMNIYPNSLFLPVCIIQVQTKRQNYFQRLLLQSRLSFIIFPYTCPIIHWHNASHIDFITIFDDTPTAKNPIFRKAVHSRFTHLYKYPLLHLSCIMSLV